MARCVGIALLLGMAWAAAAGAAEPAGPASSAGPPAPIVIPRTDAPPRLDGKLGDGCWQKALVLKGFTKIKSSDAAKKEVEARLCCDAGFLYVAVRLAEPEPAKIRAEAKLRNQQVWTDDCAEIWIRGGTNKLDLDQFLVNTLGTQEDLRTRNGQRIEPKDRKPEWEVKTEKEADAWTAEFKLPAADVGLDAFRRGDRIDLKLGREDYASQPTEYAVWPAGAPYSGTEGLAPVFIEDPNCVQNPALEDKRGWGIDKNAEAVFSGAEDGGAKVIKIVSPNHYATIGQTLKLRPDAPYMLSAEIKASGPMSVRVRAKQADQPKDQAGKPFDLKAEKSESYMPYVLRFKTGPEGDALVIVGVNEGSGTGEMFVRNLRVTRDDPPSSTGQAIPVHAGAEPLVVKKLIVTDCRAVRGFIGGPVDGSTQSGQWDGAHWEYNQPDAGAGVGYDYLHNDGLHIAFADKEGFNAVVVRGGVKAKLYRDVAQYDDPKTGTLVYAFPGQSENSRAYFEKPVATGKVSFFEVGDGFIADCSFFRVSTGKAEPAAEIPVQSPTGAAAAPDARLKGFLESRFAADERQAFACDTVAQGSQIDLKANKAVHFVTKAFEKETVLTAVEVAFRMDNPGTDIPFSLSVQDPLNPRLELHGADYELDKPGHVQLVCDFPDQIVPAGTSLWVTLRFGAPVKVQNFNMNFRSSSREQAESEALAHRLFLLRGFYATMSEARPWNGFYNPDDPAKLLAKTSSPYTPWVQEILETIDQCRAIDKEGKDDMLRQYYQWIYRNIQRRSKEGTWPFPVKYDQIEGVPEWAALAHQAWMQAREVPKWWIENRMTPNGELGGVVNDDTDMAGNYDGFPMFERDGVGGMTLDFAARLAEWAEKTTIKDGFNVHTMDPLHAYEEGLNLESQLLWWNYGDPVYYERCMAGARTLEKVTIVTPKGHRHFRSQDIGIADASMQRKLDNDGYAHCLMWHPALATAWYNRHPRVLKMLREMGDGWMEHYKECEAGKFPETIEVETEKIKTTGAEPFPGIWGGEGSVFMALAQVTGDKKYLQPYNDYLAAGKLTGSLRIHAPEMFEQGLLDAPAEKFSADLCAKSWNAALYLKGDKSLLVNALKGDVEELQRYKHMYTTVECFTDRVFLYPLINPSICYTGGYATRNKLNQNFAVSWEGLGTDFAALVLDAKAEHLKVLLCNLTDKPLSGTMRVWRLAHGEYESTCGSDANNDDTPDEGAKKETREVAKGDGIAVELPKKGVYVLELKRTKALDEIYDRADLALSRLETKVEGGKVRGVVHNIGVKDVDEVEIALVDAAGKVVARKNLGKLAAPLDLEPKTVAFELEGVPSDAKGWAVVADPDKKLAEIFRGNNRVDFGK
ncbi:MAG: hypothetical protein HY291_03115 [Planctomycetes bacterium]|nr:hypothetical protein [Planctomycetota bacterium]